MAAADLQAIYDDWIVARSFSCKKCDYTSTNRRVVEQHLRASHPDLFEGTVVAPIPAPASASAARASSSAGAPAVAATPAEQRPLAARAAGAASNVILYTDAGTWDNGTARQRSVLAVWDSRVQAVVIHEDLPGTTNNEAEYAGIIAALELARQEGLDGLLIRSDSQLCVNQITGTWQIKEERLRPLRERAARLLKAVHGRIEWVPRERNHAGIFLEKKYKK